MRSTPSGEEFNPLALPDFPDPFASPAFPDPFASLALPDPFASLALPDFPALLDGKLGNPQDDPATTISAAQSEAEQEFNFIMQLCGDKYDRLDIQKIFDQGFSLTNIQAKLNQDEDRAAKLMSTIIANMRLFLTSALESRQEFKYTKKTESAIGLFASVEEAIDYIIKHETRDIFKIIEDNLVTIARLTQAKPCFTINISTGTITPFDTVKTNDLLAIIDNLLDDANLKQFLDILIKEIAKLNNIRSFFDKEQTGEFLLKHLDPQNPANIVTAIDNLSSSIGGMKELYCGKRSNVYLNRTTILRIFEDKNGSQNASVVDSFKRSAKYVKYLRKNQQILSEEDLIKQLQDLECLNIENIANNLFKDDSFAKKLNDLGFTQALKGNPQYQDNLIKILESLFERKDTLEAILQNTSFPEDQGSRENMILDMLNKRINSNSLPSTYWHDIDLCCKYYRGNPDKRQRDNCAVAGEASASAANGIYNECSPNPDYRGDIQLTKRSKGSLKEGSTNPNSLVRDAEIVGSGKNFYNQNFLLF